jgi:ElaB/YqjD/DUF883 family membrane-anchored ribosome-binding protein
MDISDKLKDLGEKAKESAAEHKDQIRTAVEKAEAAADQQIGGRYHEQITKAGEKVQAYVENLNPAQGDAGAHEGSAGVGSSPERAPAETPPGRAGEGAG